MVLWRYRLPTRERESSTVFVVILCSIIIHSGKSESIITTNEKARLSKDDIGCMIWEAEDFAAEDEVACKCIEALNESMHSPLSMVSRHRSATRKDSVVRSMTKAARHCWRSPRRPPSGSRPRARLSLQRRSRRNLRRFRLLSTRSVASFMRVEAAPVGMARVRMMSRNPSVVSVNNVA